MLLNPEHSLVYQYLCLLSLSEASVGPNRSNSVGFEDSLSQGSLFANWCPWWNSVRLAGHLQGQQLQLNQPASRAGRYNALRKYGPHLFPT